MTPTIDDLNNQEASNLQQVQSLTSQQSSDYQAMLDRQDAQANSLYGQYTDLSNSQTPLTDVYNNLMQSTGVNAAQTALQGYKDQTYRVQGLLNNLVPDIANRTSGSLTTQAMRDRMAASEATPLNGQIQALGIAEQPYADTVTSGLQSINTQLPLVEQDYQAQLAPLTMQINGLSDTFARQLSGFTGEQQNTLNALMDQLDKNMSLSQDEWDQAQTAASQASAYNQYLQQTAASSQSTPTIAQLPQLPSSSVSIQGGNNSSPQITIPGSSLQGGNFNLQGGSGINLQG